MLYMYLHGNHQCQTCHNIMEWKYLYLAYCIVYNMVLYEPTVIYLLYLVGDNLFLCREHSL